MKAIPFKTKFLLAVGLQMALLVGLMAYKGITLLTGQSVLLETIPVDPRDLFRGDYVILDYKISRPARWLWQETEYRKGETVYVTLRKNGRFWEAEAVSRARPDDGVLFVRGTVAGTDGDALRVLYGIESYFVPEGTGTELERAAGRGLVVEAAISRNGGTAIRSVRVTPPG